MCDTFVAMPTATADGSVIFAKNSDREPNEAQSLEYHPKKHYKKDVTLKCTYLEIPQVSETNAVLICRPFWMWGAEMGANEHGVVIGNEAVFTKMMVAKSNVLTGMDLLRLSLERSNSAEQALEIIIKLLFDFGQGGICGFEDNKLTYHNSFIIADPSEAWLLETTGPFWAAKRVKNYYAISNGLTIGEKYDESHPDLITTAQKKGWLKNGQTFHFANCYSDWFYTTFSACRRRRKRSMELLRNKAKSIDLQSTMAYLRDHQGQKYQPDCHFLGNRICAHAANKLSRNSMQTTGSFIAHLKKNQKTFWGTGSSAPCTSIFKPIWFDGKVLPIYNEKLSGKFNSKYYWWRHELLHRKVLRDFSNRLNCFNQERDEIEFNLIKNTICNHLDNTYKITRSVFQMSDEKMQEWMDKIKQLPIENKSKFIYRNYWNKQNKKAGSELG